MRKWILCLAAVAASGFVTVGCESEKHDSFGLACEASGGVFAGNNICLCGSMQCESGVVCRQSDKGPVCSSGCNNEQYICRDNSDKVGIIYVCKDGFYESVTSCDNSCLSDANVQSLSAAKSNCGACVNSSVRCDNHKKQECIKGVWTTIDGATCNDCVSSETQCANRDGIGYLKRCQLDETWSAESACPDDVSCDAQGIGCGFCKNGSHVCDGETVSKKCENGTWIQDDCGVNSCDVTTGECGNCTNGDLKCEDDDVSKVGVIKKCTNGVWGEQNRCENGGNQFSCNAAGTDCGDCLNADTKCEEEAGAGKEFVCSGGVWEDSKICKDAVNDLPLSCDGKTCGDCLNASTKCENDENGVGSSYVCSAGVWNGGVCENQFSCTMNPDLDGCGDCQNGNYKYNRNDGRIDKCQRAAWVRAPETGFDMVLTCSGKTLELHYGNSDAVAIMTVDGDDFQCRDLSKKEVVNAELIMSSGSNSDCIMKNGNGKCDFDSFNTINNELNLNRFLEVIYTNGWATNCDDQEWFCSFNPGTNSYALNWFDCSNTVGGCGVVSVCVDSVVLNDNGDKLPYVITLDARDVHSDNDKAKITFTPAPNGCNLNHTAEASKYETREACGEREIAATGHYLSANTDTFEFNICQYGYVRHVTCDDLFKVNKFSCQFDAVPDDEKTWWNEYSNVNNTKRTVCVDFVNEFYDQESFVFYPKDLDKPNTVIGNAKYTNSTALEGAGINLASEEGQIRKCKNGCNADWTDCMK